MRAKSAYLLCLILPLFLSLACDGLPSVPQLAANGPKELAPAADRMQLAERIYREGVLPSGEPLRGLRQGVEVSGAQAACVLCHRRSGMGTVEGNRIIPPITGQFLYQSRARALAELDAGHTRGPDLGHALGRNRSHDPYTDETLSRAIRAGIDPAGIGLDVLMPRYALSDAEAQLLIDYLKQLSKTWSPGVTQDTLHFGTVVAPGVDPARRKAMLDVLTAFFGVKNAGTRLEKQREQTYAGSDHNTYRRWQLHVWELMGAPETWESQLAAHYRREPVFALLSGVSEGPWAPVQAFCEKQGLPCWFPSVDLPGVAEPNYYTAYFSRGVILEAEILARRLEDTRDTSEVKRVIQIRGDDAAAAGAARALEKALAGTGLRLEERVLPVAATAALREVVAGAGSSDAVVLWLRGPLVAQLGEVPPPRSPAYFSATLGGGERAPVPPAWKAQARIIYPFELPAARRSHMARFRAWLQTRDLMLVDERLQADAYLACMLMSEKVDEMLENLYRDYLLERAESILSTRLSTAMYRRLSLGPGQRFASKGGYISRFADLDGSGLVADGAWIVP